MDGPSDAELHFAELAYKQVRCWPYRQGLIIHQALIEQLPRRRAFPTYGLADHDLRLAVQGVGNVSVGVGSLGRSAR